MMAKAYENQTIELGINLLQLKQLDQAIKLFEEANVYDPDNVAALLCWAVALEFLGRREEASEKYNHIKTWTGMEYMIPLTKMLISRSMGVPTEGASARNRIGRWAGIRTSGAFDRRSMLRKF